MRPSHWRNLLAQWIFSLFKQPNLEAPSGLELSDLHQILGSFLFPIGNKAMII